MSDKNAEKQPSLQLML